MCRHPPSSPWAPVTRCVWWGPSPLPWSHVSSSHPVTRLLCWPRPVSPERRVRVVTIWPKHGPTHPDTSQNTRQVKYNPWISSSRGIQFVQNVFTHTINKVREREGNMSYQESSWYSGSLVNQLAAHTSSYFRSLQSLQTEQMDF